jgi:hypothetical protein
MPGGGEANILLEGENHPGGVMLHYYLRDKPDTTLKASLKIMEEDGTLIKTFSTEVKEKNDDPTKAKLELKQGFNRFVWNMRYPDAETFEGMILWGGGTIGPVAMPGSYKAAFTVGEETRETAFAILPDPRATATTADYQAQFDFLISVRDKLTETHRTIKQIREIRKQVNGVAEKVKEEEGMQEIVDQAKAIDKEITAMEEKLYQTKNKSPQDPLNYPIRLNNKLANVGSQMGNGNFKPTDQALTFKKEITGQIDEQLGKFKEIVQTGVPDFNRLVREKNVNAVTLEKEETVP